MRNSVRLTVHRLLLTTIPLTVAACQPLDDDYQTTADEIQTEAGQSVSTEEGRVGSIASNDYAHQRIARQLAKEQYAAILEWVRREGLDQKSHAELVALASTDAAASRYIECHEVSKTPTGYDSRLGLLSACLTQDPSADQAGANITLSAANMCGEGNSEIAVLPPDCP